MLADWYSLNTNINYIKPTYSFYKTIKISSRKRLNDYANIGRKYKNVYAPSKLIEKTGDTARERECEGTPRLTIIYSFP